MLVAVEGIAGSGKTTLASGLERRLPGATVTAEPTDSWYGEAVSEAAAGGGDVVVELFVRLADHADHLVRVVHPALARGDLVVVDRYTHWRVAAGGAALVDRVAEPVGYVRAVHEPVSRRPDLVLYLDVDPETAVERADDPATADRTAFLREVRENYERLVDDDPERFVRIDASQPPDEVLERAVAAIERRID